VGETERCSKQVWRKSGNWGRHSQCERMAVRDGFCSIHHPDAQAKRDAKRKAQYKAERDSAEKRRNIEAAERAVLQAAEAWRDAPEGDLDAELDLVAKIDALREARK
jgi:hypothetical protein